METGSAVADGSSSSKAKKTTQTNTRVCYGLEVVPSLRWYGHWDVGEAHTKFLTLKNVNMVAKKLKFKYPKTKCFETDYPKRIALPPGTSAKIPVIFRPTGEETYADSIDFVTKDGEQFSVDLMASPPCADISMVTAVDMGRCALQMSTSHCVQVTNTSSVPTRFFWEHHTPFNVEQHAVGHLEPGEAVSCRFSFNPQNALAYHETAVCRYMVNTRDSSYSGRKQVFLHGVGSHPKLSVDLRIEDMGADDDFAAGVRKLDFGRIAVDSELVKCIRIRNTSRVSTKYEFKWAESRVCDASGTFSISPEQRLGLLPAGEATEIRIRCRPKRIGDTAYHTLVMSTLGSTVGERVQCVATAFGPALGASVGHVAFPCLSIGHTQTQTFVLKNRSTVPAVYEFTPDIPEVFEVRPTQGVVPGNGDITVQVIFSPRKPFCYHRLVTCQVHHQDPFFINLIGTGYTEQLRPVELLPEHLSEQEHRRSAGLAAYGPEKLQRLVSEKKLRVDSKTGGKLKIVYQTIALHKKSQEVSRLSARNFVTHAQNTSYCLTGVDRSHVDFGAVTTDVSEVEPITLMNTTNEVIVVQWIRDETSLFFIRPESRSLEPGQRCCFRAHCEPRSAGRPQLLDTTLECFCMYRAMLDHDKVKSPFHTMSWSFSITMTAHTFNFKEEIWHASLQLNPSPLNLAPSLAKKPVHGTVLLRNTGTMAVHFALDKGEDEFARGTGDITRRRNDVISVWPASGTILANSHKVLTVKAVLPDHRWLDESISFNINHSQSQTLSVTTTTEEPELAVASAKQFCYLPPIPFGRVSERQVEVTNVSAVRAGLCWELVTGDGGSFEMQPETTIINPYETQIHTAFFIPRNEERVTASACLEYWSDEPGPTEQDGVRNEGGHESTNPIHRRDVTLVGTALYPDVQLEHVVPVENFVVVGNASRHMVRLRNPTLSVVDFQLVCATPDHVRVSVSPAIVALAPMTSVECVVTLWPTQRSRTQIKLYATCINDAGELLADMAPIELGHVTVEAMYPRPTITNVIATGRARHICKARLWKMTAIDELNSILKKIPTAPELAHERITRTKTHLSVKADTPAVVDINLGTALAHTEPSVIYWKIENKKLIDCHWEIAYPDELKLRMENWAEEVLSDPDAQLFHFLKSATFSVTPKKGCLLPGFSTVIKFKYEHHIVGENVMPVVLKVSQGREVLLRLCGQTVPRLTPYPCWPSLTHTFQPVSVRCQIPPVQPLTLHNDGTLSIPYAVDQKIMNELKKLCANHSPISCLNPTGIIPARGRCDVNFIFSPRQVSQYKFDIEIQVGEGDDIEVKRFTILASSFDQPVHNQKEKKTLSSAVSENISTVAKETMADEAGLTAKLSTEILTFGAFPTHCATSQLLYITNTHLSHDQRYVWQIPKHLLGQLVITPEDVTLRPDENVLVEFQMMTADVKVIEFDITCQVTDVHLEAQFDQDVSSWRTFSLEKSLHFTIQEGDTDPMMAGSSGDGQDDKEPSHSARIDGNSRWHTGRTTIHRPVQKFTYKTLPEAAPLYGAKKPNEYERWKKRDLSERTTARPRQQKLPAVVPAPVEPDRIHLHLLVTGRSYVIRDFKELFPTRVNDYFPSRSTEYTHDNSRGTNEVSTSELPDPLAAELSGHIMKRLLQDVLESQEFQDGVKKVDEETLPHYRQILPAKLLSQPSHLPPRPSYRNNSDAKDSLSIAMSDLVPANPFAKPPLPAQTDADMTKQALSSSSSSPLSVDEKMHRRVDAWAASCKQFYQSPITYTAEEQGSEDNSDTSTAATNVSSDAATTTGGRDATAAFKETAAVSMPSSPRRLSYAVPIRGMAGERRRSVEEEQDLQACDEEQRAQEAALGSWPDLTGIVKDVMQDMALAVSSACIQEILKPGPHHRAL